MSYIHNELEKKLFKALDDIQNLNKQIIEKEKKNRNAFISITLLILILFSLLFIFIFKKNRIISKSLTEIETTSKRITVSQKKEYNIDEDLEEKILSGISKLHKTEYYLKSDFNIQTFAKKLNTNTSYISYIINKEYNQSFKEYLTRLRIDYLVEKLQKEKKYKKYTIKFLAEEIGYTNASAFTRVFKKHKGITPSQFIKNIENKS